PVTSGIESDPGDGIRIPPVPDPDLTLFYAVPMVKAHLSEDGRSFILSESRGGYHVFQRDWLATITSRPGHAVMMTARGTGMEPTIRDGDDLLLDTGSKHIFNGFIYALGLGENILVKRLDIITGDRCRISCDNRSEYPPYELNRDQLFIIGQVIWCGRALIQRRMD
ncbi:MAG: helix-turn-helix transcriptional regulator, partial [Deltaproteobacteria bacterium]|nr:helix-turn-helix transcriptional regulator [Deltaproteobacteria bacterium]